MRSFALLAAVVVMATAAISACGDDDAPGGARGGPTRTFMLGISTLPRDLNADAYAEAFELAGTAGDVVLIRKTPPWEDLLTDGTIGSSTTETTAAELEALSDEGLQLFFAIDPTDGTTGRDRLADMPASHEGRGFEDEDVRRAFAVYAEYVAVNYRPRYLALGVEMNLYYHHQPEDFEDFVSLYAETYQRVKEVAPETQVTLTFQYEDLLARLPGTEPHFTDWQLLEAFEPFVDAIALSTYPSFAYARVEDIPSNYYTQLRGFTEHPVVIADAGFSSGEARAGQETSGELEQAAFVERLLADAEIMAMPSVVWFAGWDPSYAEGTSLRDYRSIGLLRSDGTEKPAWRTWLEAAGRPLAGDGSGD